MTNALPGDVTIDLDLDSLERPAEEIIDPFVVNIGGKTITMTDPGDLDWQDLLAIQEPTDFMRYAMSDDDREHLRNQAMPGWKLRILMDRYMKHFKLEEQVRKAQEEQERQSRRRF